MEGDAGSGEDEAGAEAGEENLIKADGHAALIAGAEVDGVAVALGWRLEGADQAQVPLGVLGSQAIERFQAIEGAQGEVAAAVGRELADFEAEITALRMTQITLPDPAPPHLLVPAS